MLPISSVSRKEHKAVERDKQVRLLLCALLSLSPCGSPSTATGIHSVVGWREPLPVASDSR